jgi:molybdopterin synthase catalytic subunit
VSPRVVSCITAQPIRLERLLTAGSNADGAFVLFVGRVRDHHDGRSVRRLHYEAYDEMAELELSEILSEAAARWDASHVEAVHRTGTLELGEASVAIAVAAPHRAAAYEASMHVMEQIKTRLPIWKREVYADGSESWVAAVPAEL